jgi:hypothetical protein
VNIRQRNSYLSQRCGHYLPAFRGKFSRENGVDQIGEIFKRLTALGFSISLVALNLRTRVFRDAMHRRTEATPNEISSTA